MVLMIVGGSVFVFGLLCGLLASLFFRENEDSDTGSVFAVLAVLAVIAGIVMALAGTFVADNQHKDAYKKHCLESGGQPYDNFGSSSHVCLGGSYVIR